MNFFLLKLKDARVFWRLRSLDFRAVDDAQPTHSMHLRSRGQDGWAPAAWDHARWIVETRTTGVHVVPCCRCMLQRRRPRAPRRMDADDSLEN